MLSAFQETMIVGFGSGLLGGVLAHTDWLIKLGREAASKGKALSVAKGLVRMRIRLMVLAIAFGAATGFLVGMLGHNEVGLTAIVVLAVLAGAGINGLARTLKLVS